MILTQWEYKVTALSTGYSPNMTEHHLDEFGLDEWQLCCIYEGLAYFKREKHTGKDK